MSVASCIRRRLGIYYFAFFAHAGVLAPYFSLWLGGARPGRGRNRLRRGDAAERRVSSRRRSGAGSRTRRAAGQRGIVVISAFAMLGGFAGAVVRARRFAIALRHASDERPCGRFDAARRSDGTRRDTRPAAAVRADAAVGIDRLHPRRARGGRLAGPRRRFDPRHIVALAALVCVAALCIPARAGAAAPAAAGRGWAGAGAGRRDRVLRRLHVHAGGARRAVRFLSIHLEAAGYSKTAIGALWTAGVGRGDRACSSILPQLMRRYSLRALLLASFACAAVRFLAHRLGRRRACAARLAQLLHAATFGVVSCRHPSRPCTASFPGGSRRAVRRCIPASPTASAGPPGR